MRLSRMFVVTAVLAAVAVAGGVSRDAAATQQPIEMNFACALKSNGLMRYVTNLNQCKNSEDKIQVRPGPWSLCIQPDGSVRKIPPFQCKKPGFVLTIPPASGTVYFCASNSTGVLRYVTSPSQCTTTEFPVFVSPNDTAPAVTTTSPANGATHVAVNTNITVNFNESVTVSTSSFSLECPSGTPKSFTVSGSPGTAIILDPTADLPQGVTCAVKVIANNVSDTDTLDPPDHPTADYNLSFTTDSAPTISSTSPANGATGVNASGNITVTFSEPVNASGSSFTIECPSGSPQSFGVSGSGTSTITLDPTFDLPASTTCTVTVLASGITDVDSGDPPDNLAANYVFSFTTSDAAPSVTSTSPADGATHVAVNTNIVVNFSEPVTASGSSFTLECPTGTPESFSVSGSPGSSITLDPTSTLPEGTICSVTVVATGISDVDTVDPPDNMVADYNFLFTTDSEPAVTTTTPADGATDVDPAANITVNFNEAVSVTTSSFTIACALIPQTFQVSGSGTSSITLIPNPPLLSTASCTVTAVAANISDTDTGDPPDHPAASTSFSFTTRSSAPVVISEVYGGGGNSGATLKNDYIELYNRSTQSVSLAGWSVQYASAAGTSWQVTTLSFSIPAGRNYLVQEAAGTGGTVDLPPPDATGTIAMSATTGKVALVSTTTALTDACPTGATIVDFVGYGSSANCFEGSGATGTLSNTTSAQRKGGGATDTDDNAADFAIAAPDPHATADAAPSVTTTTPANAATGVDPSSNITVTFSEQVNVSGSWFSISCGSSGSHSASVSGGTVSFTLDPDTDFAGSETCTVTVFASNVTDQDTDDPPDTMLSNYVFSFTTEAAASATIHDIQG